jgi:hypothetical protein
MTTDGRLTVVVSSSGFIYLLVLGKNGTKRQIWMLGGAYYLGKD